MNELACRHFLLCHTIWYNAANRGAEFGAGRIIAEVYPTDGETYPVAFGRLFAFVQLFGEAGAYTFRIRLVRIETTGFDDESEVDPIDYGPWDHEITDLEWVCSFGFQLEEVPFRAVGLYECQLWVDGFDQPVARERVQARG